MKEHSLEDYIKYRVEKSEETYKVALLLCEAKEWNSAVNRFYYACFYAVMALLSKQGIESKSHTGIKTQFFLHFAKTGKISETEGKLYAKLMDWRQKGDYGDFFDFSAHDVLPLIKDCRSFIDTVLVLIQAQD